MNKKYKYIIIFFVIFIILNIPLPYYVDAPGGIQNLDKSIRIDGFNSNGSLNIVFVREYTTNIPMILYSFFRRDYDIIKKSDVIMKNETAKDYEKRDKLLMDESISNAIYVAYKKADKKLEILDNKIYVVYNENVNSDLQLYDEILSINNKKVNSKNDITDILNELEVGECVNINIINDKKKYVRKAKILDEKKLGILISNVKEYKTIPSIEVNNDKNESGPSGGLMMSLYIYNKLIKEDITNGKKIVGTGTIELDGSVGEIGGIKYKLKSAVKNNADLFLVPNGENCVDAKKLKENKNYKIDIACVSTFDEALQHLKMQRKG